MKTTITLRIPTKIAEALQAHADERGFGEEVSELIRNGLMQAMQSQEGWQIKLKPATKPPDSNQTELPLHAETT